MKRTASLALLAALAGCVSRDELAARLSQAMVASELPKVSACWEDQFETAGFRGRYLALVDFAVTSAGQIHDVDVHSVLDDSAGELSEAHEAGELARCIEGALEGHTIRFEAPGDVAVTGYRIGFRDGNEDARKKSQSPTLLIGPRSDRCKGLYAHDPPRELALIQGELAGAIDEAASTKDDDKRARALQQSYDLALELRERLRLEQRGDLPEENKRRMRREREKATDMARKAGARIGCDDLPD